MDRINGAGTFDLGGGRRGFRDENLSAGVEGTEVTALWANMVQEELLGVISAAGLDPSPADWQQLVKAIQSGKLNYVPAPGGTANALTGTLAPGITSLGTGGLRFSVKIAITNTGPATFNLNGIGPQPIVNPLGKPIAAGDMPSGLIADLFWDGARFVLLGSMTQNLSANLTLYVRTDGNDANDGLSNTAAGAFKTLSGAREAVRRRYNANGYQVTLQLGLPGTYAGFDHTTWPGVIEVKGDVAAPASYLITAGLVFTSTCFFVTAQSLILTGLQTVAPAAGTGLTVIAGAARAQTCNWVGNAGAVLLGLQSSGRLTLTGTHGISGGGTAFAQSRTGSALYLGDPSSLVSFVGSLIGTPAFTTAFVQANTNGEIENASGVFSGAATGSRFIASTNGVINSAGGGANFFPGSTAGSQATGGQYV